MQFQRVSNATCASATGVVVVIDVLRAFSTAAYAFAAGAEEILLVGAVEEALALRDQFPGSRLMGEVNGLHIPGFDYSNSPLAFDGLNLTGVRLIQRTTAGTQGVVRSQKADHLFAASFVVAAATVRAIRALNPDEVIFVLTGWGVEGGDEAIAGDEDAACADYLEALLLGQNPDPAPYLKRVYQSPHGAHFADPNQPDFPLAELEACVRVNRFDFAMPVRREDGLLRMRPESPRMNCGLVRETC